MNDIPVVSDSDEPSWIDRYDGFLIDLDGVVYIGDAVVPGAAEAVAELRRRGKKVLFLTNDPQSFRTEYRRKLEAMHIDVVEADILSAAYATAAYIQTHHKARDPGPSLLVPRRSRPR